MEPCIETYWKMRLEKCKEALESNNFRAHIAENCSDVKRIVFESILPGLNAKSVSWGDSMTLHATDVLEEMRRNPDMDVVEAFAPEASREERIARRKKALLTDLFLTGSNAITETGKLVNLDMIGNRVGGITYGPDHVIIFAGRNKLVSDIDDAMKRIKTYAAPVNAIRHPGLKVPCMKTGYCMDCNSKHRICNTWVITEKSYPAGRINVVLINEDLGL